MEMETTEGGAMRARVGDRIILAAERIDEPTRDGEVLEARGPEGTPPFLVRWSDGHTALFYPGPGSILRIGPTDTAGAPAEQTDVAAAALGATTPVATAIPVTPAGPRAKPLGHVREWTVRISIFESGDDTSANIVLLSDAPQQLRARGTSHRSSHDTSVPEIGDEVAVARALRHLADQLMDAAETDVSDMTGEEARIRAV